MSEPFPALKDGAMCRETRKDGERSVLIATGNIARKSLTASLATLGIEVPEKM